VSPGRQDARWTSYTENGAWCTGISPRRAIHSWSLHSKCEAVTTDAVAGGTSVARAIGSDLRNRWPWREVISNL